GLQDRWWWRPRAVAGPPTRSPAVRPQAQPDTMPEHAARVRRACLSSCACADSALGDEDALGDKTMDVLLGVRDRAHPTIHRDAGKPIGVEARDLLVALEPLDRTHRRRVHGSVEIGVLGMEHEVLAGLLGRTLHVLAP